MTYETTGSNLKNKVIEILRCHKKNELIFCIY